MKGVWNSTISESAQATLPNARDVRFGKQFWVREAILGFEKLLISFQSRRRYGR